MKTSQWRKKERGGEEGSGLSLGVTSFAGNSERQFRPLHCVRDNTHWEFSNTRKKSCNFTKHTHWRRMCNEYGLIKALIRRKVMFWYTGPTCLHRYVIHAAYSEQLHNVSDF
ncbi:hypothetical protein EVAR_11136_1 [Eumeta japonica]|uniref:Uncharacterized protein n=1 Tax=Eumeta variegata TaxID=151549 RepID=A0A4C1U3Y8_EUMVA|nr:hypothetical protein EVAR_11136_1 [Eumeta japonica]